MDPINLGITLGGLVIGAAVGYFARSVWASKGLQSAETKAKKLADDAEVKAKGLILEAEHKAAAILVDIKEEERTRKKDITGLESRVLEREDVLNRKLTEVEREEKSMRVKVDALTEKEKELAVSETKAKEELGRVAKLTMEEARDELLKKVRAEYGTELARVTAELMGERRDEIEKKAQDVITVALQRYARSHVSELTTTAFHLEDEDIKGKIIGREGRNIRALERETGVEFVIDESPETIVISSFDPYRREVARMSLEKLVKDGRIQPAKIEEKVAESRAELDKRMLEIGEAAADEVGIYDIPKDLIRLLGRLHFRTSFGQNVLTHSIEMAHISGIMAAELGLNVFVSKKGALLHDIGKAIDHDVEGTHVDLGRKLLKKYGVDDAIVNAMQSHHEEYPYASPEAFIVTAADVLSAARPGARRGTIENYIKRLADLERIAGEFPGVKSAYAISAGRELRVFVIPEKIDDFRALELAREIANRIQSELKYPGEIKVNVIREMRAVEYAR